jgi:ribokinase
MSARVCVVGSLHMDLVVRAPRFPQPGETVLGEELAFHPGGKGANQAVAAARSGARVALVGCLGDDEWGRSVRGLLAAEGIELTHLRTVAGLHTGAGIITVVPGGENTIVVAPGADHALRTEDVERASGAIAEAEVLLLQGEVKVEANQAALEIARNSNTAVIYNAAPAVSLPDGFLRQVDILVANRAEACELLGEAARDVAPAGLCRRLASLGPERVVVTLGDEGALHFNGRELEHCEAFPIEAVDATGAGDAFVGALGVLRAEGARLKDAVRFACAAGALAAGKPGAIPSLPRRDELEKLARRKSSRRARSGGALG